MHSKPAPTVWGNSLWESGPTLYSWPHPYLTGLPMEICSQPHISMVHWRRRGGSNCCTDNTTRFDSMGKCPTQGNNPPLDSWALQGHQLPCLAFQWSVEGGRQLQYGVQYNSIYYLNQCTNGALVTLMEMDVYRCKEISGPLQHAYYFLCGW